jgi:hypothetical protein
VNESETCVRCGTDEGVGPIVVTSGSKTWNVPLCYVCASRPLGEDTTRLASERGERRSTTVRKRRP